MGDSIPCRVSRDLERHLRAQELAEKYAEPFDFFDVDHLKAIFRGDAERLLKPIHDLLYIQHQAKYMTVEERDAEYAKVAERIHQACRDMFTEC